MKEKEPVVPSAKNDLRGLRIFYLATIIGVTVFLIVSLVVNGFIQIDHPKLQGFENGLLAFAAVLCLAAFFYSRTAYNKDLTDAKGYIIPLTAKLNLYRTALIKYVALCEGPAIFGIVCFMITSNYLFLLISGIMIVVLLTKAPTLKRVTDDLELDSREQQELE
jgi:uncharacterized membrane protein